MLYMCLHKNIGILFIKSRLQRSLAKVSPVGMFNLCVYDNIYMNLNLNVNTASGSYLSSKVNKDRLNSSKHLSVTFCPSLFFFQVNLSPDLKKHNIESD